MRGVKRVVEYVELREDKKEAGSSPCLRLRSGLSVGEMSGCGGAYQSSGKGRLLVVRGLTFLKHLLGMSECLLRHIHTAQHAGDFAHPAVVIECFNA